MATGYWQVTRHRYHLGTPLMSCENEKIFLNGIRSSIKICFLILHTSHSPLYLNKHILDILLLPLIFLKTHSAFLHRTKEVMNAWSVGRDILISFPFILAIRLDYNKNYHYITWLSRNSITTRNFYSSELINELKVLSDLSKRIHKT